MTQFPDAPSVAAALKFPVAAATRSSAMSPSGEVITRVV